MDGDEGDDKGSRSRVALSPREPAKASTQTKNAVVVVEGTPSWHQWRDTAKREGLFTPGLRRVGAGDASDASDNVTLADAASAEAAKIRKAGDLADLSQRMAQLEQTMAHMVELLQARAPAGATLVSGARIPAIRSGAGGGSPSACPPAAR